MGLLSGSSESCDFDSRSSGSRPPKWDQARKAPSKMDVRCSNSPLRLDIVLLNAQRLCCCQQLEYDSEGCCVQRKLAYSHSSP
mmetsp:Transcript_41072/g.98998  ORF Transcript_41072/g.98998 Transcript_41072/m.98998 type:complete len:83 (+) Transcript_41072:1904-2152(+)